MRLLIANGYVIDPLQGINTGKSVFIEDGRVVGLLSHSDDVPEGFVRLSAEKSTCTVIKRLSQDNKPKRESCGQPYNNQNGCRDQSPQLVPHHHPAYAGSVNKERYRASCHGTGFGRRVGSALRGDGEPQSGQRNRGSGPEEAGEECDDLGQLVPEVIGEG